MRTAQGLVHMGKGLMGLSPYHTEHQLMSGVGLAGLLAVIFSCEDTKSTVVSFGEVLQHPPTRPRHKPAITVPRARAARVRTPLSTLGAASLPTTPGRQVPPPVLLPRGRHEAAHAADAGRGGRAAARTGEFVYIMCVKNNKKGGVFSGCAL